MPLKRRASEIFRKSRGVSMKSRYSEFRTYAQGWIGYFALDQVKTTFANLDKCPLSPASRGDESELAIGCSGGSRRLG